MNIFFGAGKVGRKYLELWRRVGLQVDYFVDNNPQIVGKMVDGVQVVSTDFLKKCQGELNVYITCASPASIKDQLVCMGISNMKIEIISDISILARLEKEYGTGFYRMLSDIPSAKEISDNGLPRILYDLENGLTLGGVESWSFENAEKLKGMGYDTKFLIGRGERGEIVIPEEEICEIILRDSISEWDRIQYGISKLVECRSTIICNFVGFHFAVSCFAKSLFPNKVKVIAILHSDDDAYYNSYLMMKGYIDKCLVISRKIQKRMISDGFPKEKCRYLLWKIPCKKNLKKVYSESNKIINLGYAGRVVKAQKRVDCLVEIAERLRARDISFKIEIAGNGDYSEILYQEIQERGLQNYIIPIGCIDRKGIPAFWNRQDIMISCSEIEGHSISQSEAMAEGAVPVITDVSGARDDVTDGYNGFVVDVGDMKTLTERICYLYHNRDVLEQMGRRAHETIYNRQKDMDESMFWNHLIKEVWQQ